MEINWTVINELKPNTVSIIIYSDANRLKESLRKTGKVVFTVGLRTKTTLDIKIFSPERDIHDSFLIAYIPAGAEDLKYHTTTINSYFHGTQTRSYLKLTKNQRLPELKKYLRCVLEQLLPDVTNLEAEIIIHDIPELSI